MRYEVIQLVQFLFSLGLVAGAFVTGLYVGWRRWGRRAAAPQADPLDLSATTPPVWGRAGRSALFAPEVDLRDGGEALGAPRELPR